MTGLALVGGSLVTAQSASAATTTVTQAGYTLRYDPAKVAAGATITGYTVPSGSSLDLNIPDSFRIHNVDYATVSIGANAFMGSTITSAVIPNTVSNIGTGAFQGSALSSVALPQSLKTISGNVFYQAKLTSIQIPDSVTSIGSAAFAGNRLVSVVIPDLVTSIGNNAFHGNQLESVVIGDSVTSIGGQAFYINLLVSVVIPDSVTSIGSSAFHANRLVSVVIGDSVTSLGSSAFHSNLLESVVIPSSVTSIGSNVFTSNRLVSVVIPDSVTSIGDVAFAGNRLVSVVIPDSVTSIGSSAFSSNLLVSVVIPGSVTSIGNWGFSSNRLVSVVIPDSVTSIGSSAFSSNRLVSVVIGDSVRSIGASAFAYNSALVDVRFLGAAPLTINDASAIDSAGTATASLGTAKGLVVSYTDEFAVAGGFTTPLWQGYKAASRSTYAVEFDLQGHGGAVASQSVISGKKASAPAVPTAAGWTFTGWFTDAATTAAYDFDRPVPAATTLFAGWIKNYTATDAAGVTYTGSADSHAVTVTGWSGSSSAVAIPSTVTIHGEEWPVTAIADGVFANQNLTSVSLPDGLRSIGADAFKGNELTELVIPAAVTTIRSNAFAGNQLTGVSFLGAAPTVGDQPFGDGADIVVSYGWEFDASNTPGGFTAPVWAGYTSTTNVPVVFDLNGHGSDVPAQQVSFGEKVTVPAAPSEAGWTFTGWFAGADAVEAYDFDSPVTVATTLQARWAAVVPDPGPTTPTPVVDPGSTHKVETSKNETHLSVPASSTVTGTAVCPTGSVATDGSVRLDAVDQDTGTFADAVVSASGVTSDGRGWTGTVRNMATGQVQGKVNVVCLEEATTRVDGHTHDVVVSAPVTADQAWTEAGTYDVVVPCATGSIAVAPSFAITSGAATVSGSAQDAAGWKFTLDVTDAAEVSVGVRCFSTTTTESKGHTHTVGLKQLTGSVDVAAGQSAEAALSCEVGGTGVVTSRTLSGGLVFRGSDPQSRSTLFRAFNPGTDEATADLGVLCVGIDTTGESSTTAAPIAEQAPQPKLVTAKLKLVSIKAKKTASGAKITIPVAPGSKVTISAVSTVKGTKIRKGSVLTSGKATGSKATLKLRGKTAKAALSGKVKTVRVAITTGGVTTSRIVRITR